jgi:hypothetical protein
MLLFSNCQTVCPTKKGWIMNSLLVQNVKVPRIPGHFLYLIMALLLTGCAANQYQTGNWQTDSAITNAFESAYVFPDHTYYYIGSREAPDSIIAIQNRFTLKSSIWIQIDMREDILKSWIGWYKADTFHHCLYYGGEILTPQHERAGYWFSPFPRNLVQFPQEQVLIVYRPEALNGASNCEEGSSFRWRQKD